MHQNATTHRPLTLVLQDQDGNLIDSWEVIYMIGAQPNKEQFNLNDRHALSLIDLIRTRVRQIRWGGKGPFVKAVS